MKKITLIIFTFCLFTSCNKRIVQLPETTNKDITDVIDVSPIYMFYDEENDSVEFNRKNMISTTNWLVNIDKRLTLKQILPHLQYLQEKRHGDGMHTNENAKNYFTCNNTDLKNLSFIEFTDINYYEDYPNKDYEEDKIYIYVHANGKTSSSNDTHNEYESFSTYIDLKKEYFKNIPEIETILSFHEDLSFQNYIDIKSKLLAIKSDSLKISNQEIIYN